MQVYKYTLEVSSDDGKYKITTPATSQMSAIAIVCSYENCPESAVKIIDASVIHPKKLRD